MDIVVVAAWHCRRATVLPEIQVVIQAEVFREVQFHLRGILLIGLNYLVKVWIAVVPSLKNSDSANRSFSD